MKKIKNNEEKGADVNRLQNVLEYRYKQKEKENTKEVEKNQCIQQIFNEFPQKELDQYGSGIEAIYINNMGNDMTMQELVLFKPYNQSRKILKSLLNYQAMDQYLSGARKIMGSKNCVFVESMIVVLLDSSLIDSQKSVPNKDTNSKKITDFFKSKIEAKTTKIVEKQIDWSIISDPKDLPNCDPLQIIQKGEYSVFQKSKKSLMIFRRSTPPNQLQLRHQRSSDVIFDLVSQNQTLSKFGQQYVYQLIETLLPNANYKINQSLKMMEISKETKEPRKGWIQILIKNK